MPRGVRAGVVPLTRGPEEHSVPRDHPLGLCASTARLPTGRKNKTPGSPEAWGEAEGPRAGPGTAAAAAAANKAARTKTPSSSSLPPSLHPLRQVPHPQGQRETGSNGATLPRCPAAALFAAGGQRDKAPSPPHPTAAAALPSLRGQPGKGGQNPLPIPVPHSPPLPPSIPAAASPGPAPPPPPGAAPPAPEPAPPPGGARPRGTPAGGMVRSPQAGGAGAGRAERTLDGGERRRGRERGKQRGGT